jgi:hypothetical protein
MELGVPERLVNQAVVGQLRRDRVLRRPGRRYGNVRIPHLSGLF